LSGYRHDPRIVGAMAGHIVLPWSHRAFSLLKRWALAACRTEYYSGQAVGD
jgi:hypothetical protein